MKKRVAVWNRYEADRKRKEAEEKKKQQDVLDRFDAEQNAPPKEADSKSFLEAPGKPADAQGDLEKVLPGFTTNKGVDDATNMARLFVAQRDRMLGRAEWLRGKADQESGSEEYSQTYSKLVTERDPWPGQLRFCLQWTKENVPGAHDAIQKMQELQDWLKNGGWAQLTEVKKPG